MFYFSLSICNYLWLYSMAFLIIEAVFVIRFSAENLSFQLLKLICHCQVVLQSYNLMSVQKQLKLDFFIKENKIFKVHFTLNFLNFFKMFMPCHFSLLYKTHFFIGRCHLGKRFIKCLWCRHLWGAIYMYLSSPL